VNTSQHSELDRIKLKIKALAAKTVEAGATEEEALAAMNVVGRLLTQYNLSMNELDVRDASYRTIHMKIGRQKRHPIDHAIPSIAALTGTKTWFHKRWGTGADSTYAFFGQEQDLDMVEYLFNVIMSAMESEVKAFKRTAEYRAVSWAGGKASAAISFQRGMASRLSGRLHQMKKEQDDALKTRSTSTALVVLKSQLVEEQFKKDVKIKLRSARTSYRVGNYGAFAAGHEAGDKVNLSRPLNHGNVVKGHLT
jgi:Protein of unknown function (DUF2786)